MELRKIFLLLIILFAAFQICFGQGTSKTELIQKFGAASNDDLQARIYNFAQIIEATPNSKGYIIIHGTKINQLSKYLFEKKIKGCFRWGKLSDKNFVFVLAENKNDFEVELWKVPKDSGKPQYTETPHDYKLLNLNNPQRVYTLNIDDSYCPLYFSLEFYSKFLKANLQLTGKIIIYEKSLKNYQKVKRKYLLELIKTNKIAAQRISFSKGIYYGEPDVEFWLVPQKKR